MNKDEFSKLISENLKMIRTEHGLTQEQMSLVIGISKKSLVETEKGRRHLSWPEAVAVSTIFETSNLLSMTFGGDTKEIIHTLAFESIEVHYPKTMGGKIWWKDIFVKNGFKIQKNIISNHYRLLNDKDERIHSSFQYEEVKEYLDLLGGNKDETI